MVIKSKDYENLYVVLDNGLEKRKILLSSIKESLELQEHIEKVLRIKNIKKQIKEDIKKCLSLIESNYLKMNNVLPEVKGLIQFTEKEITLLEKNINNMRADNVTFASDIKKTEKIVNKLKIIKDNNLLQKEKVESSKKITRRNMEKKIEKIVHSSSKFSKTDRIQNNLKIIENKLKNL